MILTWNELWLVGSTSPPCWIMRDLLSKLMKAGKTKQLRGMLLTATDWWKKLTIHGATPDERLLLYLYWPFWRLIKRKSGVISVILRSRPSLWLWHSSIIIIIFPCHICRKKRYPLSGVPLIYFILFFFNW
jgi:hypothetical protein